jgi:hypothetical protein
MYMEVSGYWHLAHKMYLSINLNDSKLISQHFKEQKIGGIAARYEKEGRNLLVKMFLKDIKIVQAFNDCIFFLAGSQLSTHELNHSYYRGIY